MIGKLSAGCKCIFQGAELGDNIINDYPTATPGKYKDASTFPAIKIYGTHCAAWDYIHGTPWYDSCKDTTVTDWKKKKNWCQSRW